MYRKSLTLDPQVGPDSSLEEIRTALHTHLLVNPGWSAAVRVQMQSLIDGEMNPEVLLEIYQDEGLAVVSEL